VPTTYATARVQAGPAGISALVLEGASCGILRKVSGGAITADVVPEAAGPGQVVKKHLGPLRYEEFELEIGFAMGNPVFDWIAQTWQMKHPRRSGSVLACTEKLEAKGERKFFQALLTETTIPMLDGSTKEPAWIKVRFAPERIQHLKGSGKASGADPKHPEKLFVPANFKLEIAGLDCSKVHKIEPFTVRQSIAHDGLGELREMTVEPSTLSFPDLKVTFAEVAVDSWLEWFDDFVVKGNCDEGKEKSGKLTLLSPNQQPLASISLFNLGIFRIGSLDSDAGEDKLKLARASLYCERMEFKLGA
jgi:hypothetical protein